MVNRHCEVPCYLKSIHANHLPDPWPVFHLWDEMKVSAYKTQNPCDVPQGFRFHSNRKYSVKMNPRCGEGGIPPSVFLVDTVETSVYTSLSHSTPGLGSLLYAELFKHLTSYDLHLAVVGIALPNEKSVGLHKKFGFEEIGIFKEYAYFKDQYVSSLWMQKCLG